VTVSLDWTYRGFDACILENELLRATVIPAVGAKIYELVYKPLGRDLLYHHPRVELRSPVFGGNVDNWWSGGIDDAIPTGHACEVDGEELPFLGEVWSLPWQIERDGDHAVRLRRDGIITPFRIERRLELLPGEPELRVSYEIANTGTKPFAFIFGVHPGLPVGPATRIDIDASRAVFAEGDRPPGFDGDEAEWPVESVASLAPEPRNTWTLLYVTDLAGGRVTVTDAVWGTGFGMTFSTDVFRCVWVWLVDGGWRGIRCVAVEPWTGYPARLDEALAIGHARTLAPGETLATEVSLFAFAAADAEQRM
jgi:galactose mutarotase-like enzyme